jgi:hypothetical protein
VNAYAYTCNNRCIRAATAYYQGVLQDADEGAAAAATGTGTGAGSAILLTNDADNQRKV